MVISGAVEWWEQWHLRILVLSSLFFQYLLLCSSPLRKFAIPSWYRSIIWLAYQGSDAVAIYALATLFNRQRSQDHGGATSANNSSILEVVWAPVLLMHLGGQDLITAYNIEDNELWTRHILTAVSQVTVAIYMFCKSWPGGDKRLLQASILFFVPGILKCIEKPWALKSASINSLVSSSAHAPSRTATREGEINSLEDYVQKARAFAQTDPGFQAQEGDAVDHGADNYLSQSQGEDIVLDLEANHGSQTQGVAATLDLEPDHHPQTSRTWIGRLNQIKEKMGCHVNQIMEKRRSHLNQREPRLRRRDNDYNGDPETYRIFVDLASPYPDRLVILKSFWVLDGKQAYILLQNRLFSIFNILYTKSKILGSFKEEEDPSGLELLSLYIRLSASLLPWAAIGLFHKSHREAYDDNDVKVTYALFCCTAVLEYCSCASFAFEKFTFLKVFLNAILKVKDSLIGQFNLVGFFARNRRHSRKMCILNFFNCKDFLDQNWSMKPCKLSFAILDLVLKYVKKGWEDQIKDTDSYWKFNDRRGQWTLQSNNCDEDLSCSLRKPFDESVLLWHIATDFCFYYMGASADHQCATAQCIQDASGEDHRCAVWCERSPHHKRAVQCREISNYMMYLLFVNPEMLLPGTRRNLFTAANSELKKILKDDNPSLKKIVKGGKPSLMEILKCNKPFCNFFTVKRPSLKEIERGFTQRIIAKVQPRENREQVVEHTDLPLDAETDATTQEGFVHDAWNLANGLLQMCDDKMWEVIEGVWVEMLCFSASRCRGYLHAKSLGTGGELLTYICLLLSHMGMETLPERLQRTELSSGGNARVTPLTSQVPASKDPPPLRRRRPHEAAAAGASTSRPQEVQPAE
ncbi:hypothetical protein CFC21_073256 [Triticum aestivum]|uniref:DUF4220 domain-containing protein n=3 Tax=Triticum TaxID=4564 RepID=A0A9R0XG58_TRITD|nr:hypothetical protein CFC21_073256 [Triticum aestivum]VAI35922.1 unnamed protein product [Triticum turgidum subsp. durum]